MAQAGRWCGVGRLALQLVLVVAVFSGGAFATLADEIRDNEVSIRFDRIYSIDDWSKAQTSDFETSMTTAVNNFCSNSSNLESCQITATGSDFTVVLSGTSPEYFNGDIKMTFHVLLPESVVDPGADNEYVLQKSTVTTIATNNQDAISAAVNETVVFINDERQTVLDTSLDVILIPIICVLFLIVVFLAVCMSCLQSRGEKKQQQLLSSAAAKKGEEGITLTAVKAGSYNSDENNGEIEVHPDEHELGITNPNVEVSDPETKLPETKPAETQGPDDTIKPVKKFRRQKRRKDGVQETSSDRTTVQVEPEIKNGYSSSSAKGIEVQPAQTANQEVNFSTNNSNDLIKSLPHARSGSRHGIELPPLTTEVKSPRGLGDEDGDKKKKRKKYHKTSKQSLVDTLDEDDEGTGSRDGMD